MALMTPDTGVSPTPSNSKRTQSKDLTRRILSFFASGELRLKTRTYQKTPSPGFRMEGNTISATNGNVSILNVHNYNGGTCNLQNFGVSSNSSDSSQVVARPKFMDKLPLFSKWDIYTEERLRDNGFCRVYAAKVNGKRTLVKEFYGKNATKAWAATARLHAATHFAPEFLRLVGASGTLERTEDEEDIAMSPFLLLEWDDLQPWRPQYLYEIGELDTAENLIRFSYLFYDIMNIAYYLILLSLPGIDVDRDVGLYQRSVKHHNLTCFRPILSLNCTGTGGHTCDIASLSDLQLLDMFKSSEEGSDYEDAAAPRTCLLLFRGDEAEVGAAKNTYGFREPMYPNPLVNKYTHNGNTVIFIFCIWTKSCKPTSRIGLLDELMDRGIITQQEWEEAVENLDPDDDGELTDAGSEDSDSDTESDDS